MRFQTIRGKYVHCARFHGYLYIHTCKCQFNIERQNRGYYCVSTELLRPWHVVNNKRMEIHQNLYTGN